MAMGEKVAAFDFDGTLTTKDTLLDFLTFCFGFKKLFIGFLLLSPALLLYKLKLTSNEKAKERVFRYFFKGMKRLRWEQLCWNYQYQIDKIINPKGVEKLEWHIERGDLVVIVSASIENWITPWANKNKVHAVIGTRIEIIDEVITGSFKSKNCYGIEKANRLKSELSNLTEYQLYAYGDTKGDRELLEMADYKFYRCF